MKYEAEDAAERLTRILLGKDPHPGLSIAAEAEGIVYGSRQADYGSPSETFGVTADLWSAWLGPSFTVTPSDVGMMLLLLKVARERACPKRDNRVDMIGYTLCLERLQNPEGVDEGTEEL